MKALIWIVCVGIAVGAEVILEKVSGMHLGVIPMAILFGAAAFAAQTLCGKWDRRKH